MTIDDARRALATQRLRRRTATRTVPRRPDGQAPPLSYAQERLWFMEQYAHGSRAYIIPVARRIRRPIDADAMAAALTAVVARHETLRTRFPGTGDGIPALVIDPPAPVPLPVVGAAGEEHARALIDAEHARPFDLAADAPIRALLVRLAADDHVLALSIHHIAADGWSVDVLIRELIAAYGGDDLPDLPVRYGDFAAWQRDQPETGIDYWRDQLAGVEPLALPTDAPRPPELTYAGAEAQVTFDADLTRSLRRLADNHGASLYMTVLAAYAALLGRHSGQADVTVGSPVAGRPVPEVEGIVGCFVNTLVMRANLGGDPTFAELLLRVRDTALDAYTHQDVPFERLVAALNVPRDPSRAPLFQALLAMQDFGPGAGQSGADSGGGDGVDGFALGSWATRFDIELYVGDGGDRLWGQIIYNTDLFTADTIERFAGRLVALLRAVTAAPDARLSSVDIRTEAERSLVSSWNRTAVAYPAGTLPGLVAAQIARTPDAPALTLDGATLTYAGLDTRAERVAAALRHLGARPGTRVGICAQRSFELVIGLLGIMRTGAAYVPLDPDYPPERLAYMATDASLLAVLTLGAPDDLVIDAPVLRLDAPPPPAGAMPGGATGEAPDSTFTGTSGGAPGASGGAPGTSGGVPGGPGPDDTAYVIYTSGSTGKPKGVPNAHRGAVNRLRWMQDRFGIGAGDTVLQKTPAGFDVSVWEFFWPLITGARLVLARPGGHKDAAYLRDLIIAEQVTTAHFVPSMLAVFLAEDGAAACTSIRRIVCSGEELPVDVARRCVATLPAELHNLYGPTEAAIDVSAWHCDPAALDRLARVPIGAPVANTTLHVLDAAMRPEPIGVPGELHIGGVQVARGYLGRPRLTADRFVPDPDGSGRLYRTGDLARWRGDGTIEFLGRLDSQVKLRGLRIELGEIEAVLREQPGVTDAAVIVREDRPGDQRIVGYVVGAAPDRERLKRVLPDYMVPSALVPLDGLPLSPNGKLDRAALPVPPRPVPAASAEPRTEEERAIAAIWAGVLDLAAVGLDDDFFDLGGHSLLATRVIARMRTTLGAGVSVMDMFKHPTVRGLAALTATPAAQRGPRPLLHELTPPRPQATISLVCVPYGGGSAVAYQPLADALPEHYRLWSVEMPGHDLGVDEARLPFGELIARCVAEITANVAGPVAIYGHCGVGSAVAVGIARELEASGRRVERVYIGAMFPFAKPRGRIAKALSGLGQMEKLRGDRLYANWLTSIGLDLSTLDPAQAKHIIQVMRKDSAEAEDYYTAMFEADVARMAAPFTSIVGSSDEATEFYPERYREWHFLSDEASLFVLREAGHYFLKYRPDELAAIIATVPSPEDVKAETDAGDGGWYLHAISTDREPDGGPEPSMARFGAVAAGQVVSMIGSAMTEFAIPVWVYLTTGSVERFALFAVLGLVPGLLVLPFAGAMVDRYNRRLIMLGGDLAAGGVQAVLGVLVFTGHLHVWSFYPATVLLSVALTFQRLAYSSSIPQLVPKRLLGHAAGIGQLSGGLAQLATPLLAAGLLAAIGLKGILTIDVASYLVAVGVVCCVRFPRAMAWRRKETMRAEIAAGFRYVWRNPHFRRMLTFFAVLNVPLSALFVMISPLVLSFAALRQVGEVSFVSAIGVTLGGFAMTFWGGPGHRRMYTVLISTFVIAAFALVTGLRPSVPVIAVGALGMALGLTVMNGVYGTIVQVKVPQRLHGRVFALNTMIAWSTMPIGFGLVAPYASVVLGPLLEPGGALAPSVGAVIGTGPSRGIGFMYIVFAVVIAGIAAVSMSVLRGFDDSLPDALADDLVGIARLAATPTASVPVAGGRSKESHELPGRD